MDDSSMALLQPPSWFSGKFDRKEEEITLGEKNLLLGSRREK
jgi:hypothetical protein